MAEERSQRPPLRRVGAIWKPRTAASPRTRGTGTLTINGLKQRFLVLQNDRKTSDRDPDFVLVTDSEPETDGYAREAHQDDGF